MACTPREKMVELFMKPVPREKAERLADAFLTDVAELKLESLHAQERVERAYETGFFDGRHGTPCEQIEAWNQLEVEREKCRSQAVQIEILTRTVIEQGQKLDKITLDLFVGEDRETEK